MQRWLSVDPLMAMFAGDSPYLFCSNNPINFTDVLGLADTKNDKPSKADKQKAKEDKFSKKAVRTKEVVITGKLTITEKMQMAFSRVIVKRKDQFQKTLNKVNDVAKKTGEVVYQAAVASEDWGNGSGGRAVGEFMADIVGGRLLGNIQNRIFGDGRDIINGEKTNDKALVAEAALTLIPIGKLKQIHHIIPKAVFNKYATQLASLGYKLNHAKNLMELPVPFHGNHPSYSKMVLEKLDDLFLNPNVQLNDVVKLQNDLRGEILQRSAEGWDKLNDFYKAWGYKW